MKNSGSHGLGLSICKNIVTGMNGQLDVQSELGVGSTFTITLQSEMYDRSKEQKKVSTKLTAKWVIPLGNKIKKASKAAPQANRQKDF